MEGGAGEWREELHNAGEAGERKEELQNAGKWKEVLQDTVE